MAIGFNPLHDSFVAEVDGIDLRAPVSDADIAAIEAAIDQYAVLIFPDQDVTDEQQLAFSRRFGDLELPGAASNITKDQDRRLGPEMADLSNLNRQQERLARDDRQRMFNLGNRLWHSDSSFRATPAKFSLLSARIVPSTGGETQFADMRTAYDQLDAATKAEIEDLVCEHSLMYSRGLLGFSAFSGAECQQFKPVRQRLVRVHPATERKSLYLSAHAGTILGWPRPEALAFLRDLNEGATQPELVHSHSWRPFDLVMWDNRQTMHRVRPFDDLAQVRDMRRTTVAGTDQTVEQVA